MKKFFYAIRLATVPFLMTLFFTNCEQDEALDLIPSTDANVELADLQFFASSGFSGRIAISADGNDHDRDDIGATPMGLALLAQAGLQQKLVHYDYNSHIWGNGSSGQKNDMKESTLGAASRFNFNKGTFISAIDETDKAERSIAEAINKSSSSNPLYILVAGPMAVVCEGIKRSDNDKRKHVTIISHSDWNDEYQKNGSCTAKDVKKTGVKFIRIKDQNSGLRGDWSKWSWLQKHSDGKLQWVYNRMKVAMSNRADVSDAGMIWYLLHNDQNANSNKLKSFFEGGSPSPGDGGGGGNGDYCQATGSTLKAAIRNFENSCNIKYDKSKGHDCDPDGKGGWICDNGGKKGGSGGGNNPGSPAPPTPPTGNDDYCQATGSTLNAAIRNFENSCNTKYDKSKGHDCDPDGRGGWICDNGEKKGGSGGGNNPNPGSPPPPPGKNDRCRATGSSLNAAIRNFENSCNTKYDKSKGHDCDPDGKGGWICATSDL